MGALKSHSLGIFKLLTNFHIPRSDESMEQRAARLHAHGFLSIHTFTSLRDIYMDINSMKPNVVL